jgi:hypothetical protein
MMPFLANTKIHQNLKTCKIVIDSKNVTILTQVKNLRALMVSLLFYFYYHH